MDSTAHRDRRDRGSWAVRVLVRALTSVRLAVILVAALGAVGIAATLVPGWGARAFASPVFLVPAAAFIVNLSACSASRFVRELRRHGRRRHGPDVLHLGILVLAVGSAITSASRGTGAILLAPGDSARLPDGSLLTVTDLRFERYSDGRPREWVSTLSVTGGRGPAVEGFELRVNRPLRRGRLSFYQTTYEEHWELELRDGSVASCSLREGESADVGGSSVLFMSAEGPDRSGSARAEVRVGDGVGSRVARVAAGDPLGPSVEVADLRRRLATGITAVADPGWPVAVTGLAMVAAGLAITFAQKLREVS